MAVMESAPQYVAIGTSAGGVKALQTLLSELRSGFATPIGIVQHMPPTSRFDVSQIYRGPQGTKLFEVEDKSSIEEGGIAFSTPDYHLLVEDQTTYSLSQDEPVHHSRPSIDLFFTSVADVFGPSAIGVLLTGASQDGAAGLRRIAERGGFTIVQDPKEAEHKIMPEAALALLKPHRLLTLAGIGEQLNMICTRSPLRAMKPDSQRETRP